MNIKEFNRLPKERQIELLQRRLGEMKSQKLKTTDFTNDEFNFSWPSQKIKELGYWYDQTNYCLVRYAMDGEMVISKKEYKALKEQETNTVNVSEYENEIAALKKQIEELKMKSETEQLLLPYLRTETATIYIKMPKALVPDLQEYCLGQIWGRQRTIESVIIRYMKKDLKESVVENAELISILSEDEVEYKVVTASISGQLLNEWKEYCKRAKIFNISQITTIAFVDALGYDATNISDILNPCVQSEYE